MHKICRHLLVGVIILLIYSLSACQINDTNSTDASILLQEEPITTEPEEIATNKESSEVADHIYNPSSPHENVIIQDTFDDVTPTVPKGDKSSSGSQYSTAPTDNSNEAPTIGLDNPDRWILKKGMTYYQGKLDATLITSVTFSHEMPSKYDERWSANVADTDDIVGYRVGTDVYIVGDIIKFNPSSRMMFCVRNQHGDPIFASLREVNGLDIVDTSLVLDMSNMFYNGIYFEQLDVGNWDVSNVTKMKLMFAGCVNLESLDVSGWDVGNVEDFTAMFQGSSHKGDMKLKDIDVSKWDTSSAIKMGHMFYGCGQMTHIGVDNWAVDQVKTFTHMFADCFALQELNLTNWDTSSVESFDALLNDCDSLKTIDVSGLETATCKQFSQMFESCDSLVEIVGLETWDVSNAQTFAFSEAFHGCKNLTHLDLKTWNTAKADNMARMFAGCVSLQTLDLSSFDISNVQTMVEMFKGCSPDLELIGIDNWSLIGIDTTNMF